MMSVAVNGRFQGRRVSGVERYATEITRCFGGKVRIVRPRRRLQGIWGHLWEQLVLSRRVSRDELLWSPANSGPMGVCNQVVTIHDLSVLEHPGWFSPGFALWYRLMLPTLARRARHILTVSEHSRKMIMGQLGVPADKVTTVPNGVNHQVFKPTPAAAVRRKYRLPPRYVLFVGSIDPRKNLGALLQAWCEASKPRELQLVIAGDATPVFRRVDVHERDHDVRLLGYVPDEDLPGLYSGAEVFIMPSLYEGFGLTLLEAMACGTPVISSTGGALPEVADGAALLVDPTSVEAMAAALTDLLGDDCLREELRTKGSSRAGEFTWESSARRVRQVLEDNA